MKLLEVPFLSANDDSAVITNVYHNNGDAVKNGNILFSLETTKSAVDIESEIDGYFFTNVKVGEKKHYGEVIGLVSPEMLKQEEIAAYLEVKADLLSSQKITKKAEILAAKFGISIEQIKSSANGSDINENTVLAFIEKNTSKRNRIGLNHAIERVGILGGVSGGGALIVVDAIIKCQNQVAVGIFDNDKTQHGQKILGVPIIGNTDDLLKAFKNEEIDSVVIAFNRDLDERAVVFNDLKAKAIPFTNVIDPSVSIRMGVKIGEGNIILANTYIAACTQIGDNNFISSNICIEHGNIIGSHNAFGPGVFTSGNVTVKDKIRFGTGVFIEPNVSIGESVNLGSFVLIDKDIEDKTILKRKQDFITRSK